MDSSACCSGKAYHTHYLFKVSDNYSQTTNSWYQRIPLNYNHYLTCEGVIIGFFQGVGYYNSGINKKTSNICQNDVSYYYTLKDDVMYVQEEVP